MGLCMMTDFKNALFLDYLVFFGAVSSTEQL